MTDQQRFDTISAYGLNEICRTPHIDALAEQGVRFSHAFTPTAICSPARASFYTGLYPRRHGVTANGLTLREGVRTLSDYLFDTGYAYGYAGKWHVDQHSDLGFVEHTAGERVVEHLPCSVKWDLQPPEGPDHAIRVSGDTSHPRRCDDGLCFERGTIHLSDHPVRCQDLHEGDRFGPMP